MGTIRCVSCGQMFDTTNETCPNCGTSKATTMNAINTMTYPVNNNPNKESNMFETRTLGLLEEIKENTKTTSKYLRYFWTIEVIGIVLGIVYVFLAVILAVARLK